MKTSNMDYEKKYKEALEKIRSLHRDYNQISTLIDVKEELENIFPELKESEDERVGRELIEGFKRYDEGALFNGCLVRDIVAWLEKQVEQKTADNGESSLLTVERAKEVSPFMRSGFEPADKVEPKFKVEKDKWYICVSQYCNCIEGRVYKATSDSRIMDDFGTEYDMQSDAYKYFRLWTIQDAKDGDVLATEDWRFIFKKINSNGKPVCHCHYDIDLGFRIDTNSYIATGSEIYPATKEQHDLLFQKMKEAGYEWDAEKKELKKVEQKPAWSEEDEDAIGMAIIAVEDMYDEDEPNTTYGGYNLPFNKAAERLKSLKDRVQPQPKQEWSEEDERIYQSIIDDTVQENQLDDKQIDWLRDIKYRHSSQPQNTWKPSDEQIKALSNINVTGGISYAGQGQELINLYNDLKKL